MDDLEKTLWATIDIKGYGAYVMTASMGLEDIKSKVHKRKKVADDWSLIVSAYEPISKAAEAIDLNALDDRFPADVVREVKCLLIPELNQSYNTLNSLLTEYRPGKSKNVNSIIKQADVCRLVLKQMGEAGMRFKTPRFIEYKTLIEQEKKEQGEQLGAADSIR